MNESVKWIVVVATAIVFVGALIQVQAQCRKPISQEEAIEIANRTVTTTGFDLNDLDRTIARDVEERKKHLKWSIDGQLGEEARQEAQQMDTALRNHTNVYAVIYQPKRKPGDREVLGGISVIVDVDTGEVVFTNLLIGRPSIQLKLRKQRPIAARSESFFAAFLPSHNSATP